MGNACSACFDKNEEGSVTVTEPERAVQPAGETTPKNVVISPEVETLQVEQVEGADLRETRHHVPEDGPALQGGKFTLVLHSAEIKRSFAKFGHMDPYAVIEADGKEVGRSKPDKSAHKTPHWESSFSWETEGVPKDIHIAVYDKNDFHRDVFIGAVTIPCSSDMGSQENIVFTLTKKSEATGTIKLNLAFEHPETKASEYERSATLGLEMDHVVRHLSNKNIGDVEVHLEETEDHKKESWAKHPAEEGKPQLQRSGSRLTHQESASDLCSLMGSWKCVETHGLDAFLKATGVGVFQRKIANAAKWPGWEYQLDGDQVKFTNHSAIGDLIETFPLNKDYDWKDGHGNPMTCKATWTKSPDGGTLFTERNGKIGSYKEERKVIGNRLEFTLIHGSGVEWGRCFEKIPA